MSGEKKPAPQNAPGPVGLPANLHVDGYHRPDEAEARWIGMPASGRWTAADSVRRSRQRLSLACFAFALGAITILLSSPVRNRFLAPGPLAQSHAQILSGLDEARCSACHENGNQPVAAWLLGGWKSATGASASCQSELCLKCHDRSLPGGLAMQPHNVKPADLQARTERQRRILLGGSATAVHPVSFAASGSHPDLACSTCHREHQPDGKLLSQMTDAQCQICHTRSFRSFESDHPPFAMAGGAGSRGIRFDHASHGLRHFQSKGKPFECQSCHQPGRDGNLQLIAGFEQGCASCHNDAIVESQRKNLELVAIPMLDADAIRAQGMQLESWPAAATGDFDGELPVLTRLLLSGDPALRETLRALPATFRFSDLNPAIRSDMQTAAELANGLQRLMRELAVDGRAGLKERIRNAWVGENLAGSPPELPEDQLPSDQLLAATAKHWMPELVTTGTGASDDRGTATSRLDPAASNPVFQRMARQDEGSGELLAVNPLAGKLVRSSASSAPADSLTAAEQPVQSATATPENGAATASIPELPAQQSARQEASRTSGAGVDIYKQTPAAYPPANVDGETLAVNPLKGKFGKAAEAAISPLPDQREPKLADNLADRSPPGEATPKLAENQPDKPPAARFFLAPSPSDSAQWLRDDVRMVLARRPSGHDDPWAAFWIEVLSAAPSGNTDNSGVSLLARTMLDHQGPGQCLQCHSLPSPVTAGQELASLSSKKGTWRSWIRDPAEKGFTRFNHQPHLLVADCQSCHALVGEGDREPDSRTSPFQLVSSRTGNAASSLAGPLAGSPAFTLSSHSGLRPLTPANCSSCHHRGGSPTGCTTCHHYHVEVPASSGEWRR